MVIKKLNFKNFKITVEEVPEHRKNGEMISHIATFWDKTDCLEMDRNVREFETFGGAVDQALEWLADEYRHSSKTDEMESA